MTARDQRPSLMAGVVGNFYSLPVTAAGSRIRAGAIWGDQKMAGRKPKPTDLHRQQGTYQAVRHDRRANEPRPQGNLGEPPDELGPAEAEIWRYAIASAPAGLLKRLDLSVFVTWVRAVHAQNMAAVELARDGLIVDTGKGPAEHPASRAFSRASVLVLRCASELGFSPAARPRIQIDGAAEEKNPFASFGGGRTVEPPAADDDAVH